MRPNSSSVVIREDLSALVYEAVFNPNSFQMVRALPIFRTPKKNGQYPFIPKESFLKLPEKMVRAPRTAYSRADIEFGMKSYETEDRGLEIPLDDVEKAMYGHLFPAEEAIVQSLASAMMRKHEIAGAELLTDTSSFVNEAAAKKWNLKADADPRADIAKRIKNIRSNTGIEPDSVILSASSLEDVLDCASFLDQCQGILAPHLLSKEEQLLLVAKYFKVSKLIVIGQVKDTSKNPRSTNISDIWPSDKVMVAKTADNPMDLREACVGRTFLWEEYASEMIVVENYREEKISSDIYRGKGFMKEVLVSATLGEIVTGAR